MGCIYDYPLEPYICDADWNCVECPNWIDELEECKEIMNTISGESKYAIRMDDVRNTSTIIEGSGE